MPVVTTLSGRRVDIPPGYEVVPTEGSLLTLVSRSAPRRNLLIGLEVGVPHRYPSPFEMPPELPKEVRRAETRPAKPEPVSRYGPSTGRPPLPLESTTYPLEIEEQTRIENERRRRGLLPLPVSQAPPPQRRGAPAHVETLGTRNLRVAVLPGEVVDAVRALALDIGNVGIGTVGPIAAYGIWTAALHAGRGQVSGTFALAPPARIPGNPPYDLPVTQVLPVTYRSVSALVFAIYGAVGVPPRRTLLDALNKAGWHAFGERIPGSGEAEYLPPERPTPMPGPPRFVPRTVEGGQFRFE